MTYRALLIGNSTFDADAGLNPLNAPTKDVARLHHALVDRDTGMFAEENLRLITELKHVEIRSELDEFFASGQRDDLMLLYYSGHGVLNEHGQLFLCARDTRSDRLAHTGISDEQINSFIRGANSMRTILILDCCSSGMFKGGPIGTQLGGPGRYIVSSARGKTLANDGQSPTGTSLFTEHLVEGLLGGARDVNGDGLIDLHEIYDFVKKRLAETSKQIPHSRFDGDGDVSMARIRQSPAPAIAIAADTGRPRRVGEMPFGLSENVISLREIGPDERLRPEIIEICRFSDSDIDIAVETLDDWLQVQLTGDRLAVTLSPRYGHNRGKILVRDRISGTVATLRVDAFRLPEPNRTPRVETTGATHKSGPQTQADAPRDRMAAPVAFGDQVPPWTAPTWNTNPQNPPHLSPTPPLPPRNSIYQPVAPPPIYPGPGSSVAKPGTNGTAIASLVLSLVWLYGIGSVLAIFFAHKAKKEIARTGQGGTGLATAGNIVGWLGLLGLVIVVAVVASST